MPEERPPSEGSSSTDPKPEEKPAQAPKKKTTFDLLKGNTTSKNWRNSTSGSRGLRTDGGGDPEKQSERGRWTLGILADRNTDEVPGTVVLLSKYSTRNIPLGLQHEATRGRRASRGSMSGEAERRRSVSAKKKTPDGQVILDPQPDDSLNDPLNWPAWRRDCALLSLGFYCMVGGGMTPILAAGFKNVADTFHVTFGQVALTTGLYMMGLGVGSVLFSPTAILFGKRPVYLFSSIMFVATSIWCAVAPSYAQLATARVFQGISVSPVECLPSATIAEIFFLHERAFRVGIYTLLLLGGKNLVPLVSAAVIQGLGWRWVFYIVAIIVGFGGVLLFLFVPETFWDRTPRPRGLKRRSESRLRRSISRASHKVRTPRTPAFVEPERSPSLVSRRSSYFSHRRTSESRDIAEDKIKQEKYASSELDGSSPRPHGLNISNVPHHTSPAGALSPADDIQPTSQADDYINHRSRPEERQPTSPAIVALPQTPVPEPGLSPVQTRDFVNEKEEDPHEHGHETGATGVMSQAPTVPPTPTTPLPQLTSYTTGLRHAPPKGFTQTLQLWNGRLSKSNWFRVALRPFILFAYPAVLWSALVYSLSVGWLIVISESVSEVYRNRESYNFSAMAVGLVYMSPFIGGVLGTAVAGKFSDVVVRYMARRNDGIYEPEYRLVMAVPIAFTTAIGLMGFGWSAEERDAWIVPTVFFGIISFGCSLGSTTSITFCVDSYRQYAGEALVTLNFSKNVLHGLVWSLFFPHWLESDGSKKVFLAIGGIQIACMLFTIPMYIYGKRARMWTVRKALMDKF